MRTFQPGSSKGGGQPWTGRAFEIPIRVIHTLWLSLVTTFFPALAASLHGALAQSESYRLHASSERLEAELKGAIERIKSVMASGSPAEPELLKAAVEAAVALILEEHQDWQMLVRPHHLPLA